MRRGPDLGQALHDLDIGRGVIERVVADERAERLTAQLAELGLIDFLEQRALIPGRVAELPQHPPRLVLGDVQDPDLQILAGRGVADQVPEALPRGLQLLEILVVDNQVDLLCQRAIDRSLHRIDGGEHVVADDLGVRQRLLRERPHRLLDPLFANLGVRLEFLT